MIEIGVDAAFFVFCKLHVGVLDLGFVFDLEFILINSDGLFLNGGVGYQ